MLRMMGLALIAGAQIVSLAAGAESPDASGKWTADLAKCDFGMEAVPTSLVYGVEQKGVTLRVERIRQEDGKETKTARTFEARWDGAALILEYHANYQGYDLDVTEKWTLSDDKKALTVLRSVSAGGGGTEQRLVFHKESSE